MRAMSGAGERSTVSGGTTARIARWTPASGVRRRERREQIDALARGEELDREHVRREVDRARELERGAHAHADVIFAAGRRRDRVDAGGMRERLDLGRERRGRDVRHHQAGVAGRSRAIEERRQAALGRRHQPLGAALADRRELREAERQRVGGERDRARRGSCRRRRCRPVSAKTIGLSVAALTSISASRRAKARASRAAPCTCGTQRSA